MKMSEGDCFMWKRELVIFFSLLALILGLSEVDRTCGYLYGCKTVYRQASETALEIAEEYVVPSALFLKERWENRYLFQKSS